MTTQENIPYTADEIKAMVKTCEKYNKALERASELLEQKKEYNSIREYIEYVFPELEESRDDRIKKALIKILNEIVINTNYKELGIDYNIRDMIAWVEKQGENKPTDKVESKFHEGEWITNGNYTWKIVEVKPLDYILQSQDGNIVDDTISYIDKHFHLWSINNAKDGDVLMTTKTRNCPFIYRKTSYKNNLAYYYVGIDGNGDLARAYPKKMLHHFGPTSNVTPATKEQRDTLFARIKKAGYEWDSEKKELKKIESKKLDVDKMIEWLKNTIRETKEYFGEHDMFYNTRLTLPYNSIEDLINDFKEDFGL